MFGEGRDHDYDIDDSGQYLTKLVVMEVMMIIFHYI